MEVLLMVYPLAPSIIDDQGMLPIHLACRNGALRGVVVTLLNAYLKSINIKDKKGRPHPAKPRGEFQQSE